MNRSTLQPKATAWTLVGALAATALALIVLALANTVTPYGWKVFVLVKIFKIGWAATVAFALALGVQELLAQLFGRDRRGVPTAAICLATLFATFASALIALGYLMPDWYPWSDLIAGVFVGGWAGVAILIRGGLYERCDLRSAFKPTT